VNEHRIHFRPESVRAILAGTKTMTRRVVKPQPTFVDGEPTFVGTGILDSGRFGFMDDARDHLCPYGAPGDRLWVRETWCQKASNLTGELIYNKDGDIDPSCCHYRADGNNVVHHEDPNRSPWRPSIHMPRRCSRLTLRVEDVRVERVQEITEEDARAEGIFEWSSFVEAWDAINGKRHPWESNPFVWCISFSVLGVKP